jgi:7-carboxy-7-deazaguanine synthase
MHPTIPAHRVALLTTRPTGTLLIHEIYRSLQGESSYAGLPCVFVRFSVCDLRCKWCDTPHAFGQGTPMDPAAIREQVLAFDCPLVEFTGGEPLLQPEIHPLMRQLLNDGKTVLLETSGAHDLTPVDPRVHLIMDLKCPDSGEVARNRWENLPLLKPSDEIKFVIASRVDFDWMIATVREHQLAERCSLLASAVFGSVTPLQLANWLLESGEQKIRMQLQLHKYIWDPQARGV